MFKIEVNFDDSGLRRLERNAQRLAARKSVTFGELFSRAFMAKNTKFASIESLLEASGYKVESTQDFEAIPDAEWDRFIAANTQFSSWEEMQQAAATEWAAAQLDR